LAPSGNVNVDKRGEDEDEYGTTLMQHTATRIKYQRLLAETHVHCAMIGL